MKRAHVIIIFCAILTVGVGLRFAMGGDRLLWQDEAETTINALQVLDVGYPNSTFEGKPIYENASY
ncbi:MAG: hypothetical protein WC505_03245, partial [Patescibacteria group bacterium]